MPALQRGRARATGSAALDGFVLAGPAFTCVGRDEEEMATAIAGTKNQIAFYASTRRTVQCSTTTAGARCNPSSPG